jgi:hypothetical protein
MRDLLRDHIPRLCGRLPADEPAVLGRAIRRRPLDDVGEIEVRADRRNEIDAPLERRFLRERDEREASAIRDRDHPDTAALPSDRGADQCKVALVD